MKAKLRMVDKAIERYKNASITIKASLWFTLCNIILKGISFITVPLFARILSSEEYGTLSVFISYEAIILTLSTWEIALSAYQKGIYKYKDNVTLFTRSTIAFSNILTLLFFSLVFLFFPAFHSFTGISAICTILLFVFMLMQPSYNCWLIEKRTNFEYKKATCLTILFGIVTVLIPLVAVLVIGKTAEIKFAYTLISSIGVYIFFYVRQAPFFLLRRNVGEKVKKQWKFILTFQAPIVVHALSYTFLSQADRVMIEKMVGASSAAFYSVAYNIAMVISLIQNSINQALVPWRFEKLEKKEFGKIEKSTAPLLIGIGTLVLAFIFIAPEIILLLFSSEYYEAIWCIPPVSLSVYFMFLYSIFVWIENYYEKTRYVAIVSVSCAVLNLVLNYCLIGVFGYVACAYTTLFSYVMFCVGHYFFMKKTLREKEIMESVFDTKACVVISTILIIGMLIATFTYKYIIIRYTVISIICVCVIYRRRTIKQMFSDFRKE